MPLSTAGKNVALNALRASSLPAAIITHLSIHNGIPNDSGSNEISGGSPAYARKAVAFNAAAGGAIQKDATDPSFDIPAGTTCLFVGYWSASSGGTFLGYGPINDGNIDGVATVANSGDVITSYSHGLANNDRVYLQSVMGQAIPSGLDANTLYYVVGTTSDTFQLSLTQGGSAIVITTDGELAFQKVVPEVYGSQGILIVDTATIDLNA